MEAATKSVLPVLNTECTQGVLKIYLPCTEKTLFYILQGYPGLPGRPGVGGAKGNQVSDADSKDRNT